MGQQSWTDPQFDSWLAFMTSRIAVDCFHHYVVGVNQRNSDGTARQEILKTCRPRQLLWLVREPGNRHDRNAVKVTTLEGEQLGYLDRQLGQKVAKQLLAGDTIWAFVRSVLEDEGTSNYGIVIVLMQLKPAIVEEIRAQQTESTETPVVQWMRALGEFFA